MDFSDAAIGHCMLYHVCIDKSSTATASLCQYLKEFSLIQSSTPENTRQRPTLMESLGRVKPGWSGTVTQTNCSKSLILKLRIISSASRLKIGLTLCLTWNKPVNSPHTQERLDLFCTLLKTWRKTGRCHSILIQRMYWSNT